MKKLRKITLSILSAFCVLGITTPVFAEGEEGIATQADTSEPETYVIQSETIHGADGEEVIPVDGVTYLTVGKEYGLGITYTGSVYPEDLVSEYKNSDLFVIEFAGGDTDGITSMVGFSLVPKKAGHIVVRSKNIVVNGAKIGWVKECNDYYYYNSNGEMVTNQWVGNYYLGSNGKMATNQWIGDYYVGTDGLWIPNAPEWQWRQSYGNWYYYNTKTETYKKSNWLEIGDIWYYFDAEGVMVTGRQTIAGNEYYFATSGAMQTGWVKEGNDYYYYNSDGAMLKNQWLGNYYLEADGKMAKDQWIGNYYVGTDGAWIPNAQEWQWKQEKDQWYCYNSKTETYATNEWVKISGTWYYFDAEGVMVTGSQTIAGNEYYFATSGAMQTGWVKEGNDYYYYNSDGAMLKNQWLGNYYLGADGKMAKDQWIGNYYVGTDGAWVPNAQEWQWRQSYGNWYYYNTRNREYASGWKLIGGEYYYFDNSGVMATGKVIIGDAQSTFDDSGREIVYWSSRAGSGIYHRSASEISAKNLESGLYSEAARRGMRACKSCYKNSHGN